MSELYHEIDVGEDMPTAVKALNEEGTRIGGYVIVYGSQHNRDAHGEWFTPETAFQIDWYPIRPMLYHHALDPEVGGELIGIVDTLIPDEIGVWCEGTLELRSRYGPAIKAMVERGELGWSSGSLPHLVKKAPNGEILRWPVIECSITKTPAQRRNSEVAVIKSAYHALGLETDRLEGVGEDMTDELNVNLVQTVTALAESVKSLREEIARPNVTMATKRLPQAPSEAAPQTRVEVVRATKYSDLSASDMAFLHEIMSSSVRNWNPGEGFYRELADKSFRAVHSGQLGADAVKGLHALGYTKANELDSTGQAGFGQEWSADSWRAELWQKVRQENIVAPLFPFVEMPTSPFELPIESGDPTVYFVPETTDAAHLTATAANPITLSKIGSGKIQMNAKKLALRVSWSSELNEDSVIPVIAHYRTQAVRAMQNAIDNVLLNGDTVTALNTNINLIDGTPTAGTKYLAFDGLRKYALVTNSSQSLNAAGAPTLALLRQARFKLSGHYATQPRNCAWIVDDNTYNALLNMSEFLTMDKAGAHATNLSGQIGVIDGVPVFATAEMGLANANGKISGTPANNTKGQAIIVFRPNFMIGYRRQVQANVEFFPWADAYHLVVTVRLTMVSFDGTSAAELYNVTV